LFRNRPSDDGPGNYAAEIARFLARNPPAPGTFTRIVTLHDDGCGFFRGAPCDCEPEVKTLSEHRRDLARRN
jgi:hypothetical protein